jgi:hypothetical protein
VIFGNPTPTLALAQPTLIITLAALQWEAGAKE